MLHSEIMLIIKNRYFIFYNFYSEKKTLNFFTIMLIIFYLKRNINSTQNFVVMIFIIKRNKSFYIMRKIKNKLTTKNNNIMIKAIQSFQCTHTNN